MVTQAEAVIEAFESLGKDEPRTIKEIADWVSKHYPERWRDCGTQMADMVSRNDGGNQSSTTSEHLKMLIRTERGIYRMKKF